LDIFRRSGNSWRIAAALIWLGFARLQEAQYDQATALLEESLRRSRDLGDTIIVAHALGLLGMIARLQGDYARSVALHTESLLLHNRRGSPSGIAEQLDQLGCVAWARGDHARAARLCGAAEACWELFCGGARLSEEARAFGAAVRGGQVSRVTAEAWADGHTLTLEQGIAYGLAQPVAQLSAGDQERPVIGQTRAMQPMLRIYALGPARVERSGQVLNAADWGYAQPRDLLFYLLCHGRRTKEQVGLDFWPDAAPAQLRSNFHRTLHHIRQALGHADWVVRDQGGYAFNRALPYWYDVEAFEAHLHAARQIDDTEPSSAIRHLEQAINLYQGDFLQECAADWYLPRQRALRERYQEALVLLGELRSAEDRHSEAAEIYRRAIDHDNLLEEAHRALMRSYARQGERGQALRHYQSLVETLQAEIGADPAPETTALYQQLRRGDAVV
jgi:DNA-binding SARP family transcriptional activator